MAAGTIYRDEMAAERKFAEGPGGGRFLRFLDSILHSVVTFFVAIFRVLVSVIPPSQSKSKSKSKCNSRDEFHDSQQNKFNKPNQSGTTEIQQHHHHPDSSSSTISQDGDHGSSRMQPSLQVQPLAATRSKGPREVNANANANGQPNSIVKVALPRMGLPNGVVKQENQPAKGNGAAVNVNVKAANHRDLANGTKSAKFRSVGEEQAEENRQEYITLPPVGVDDDHSEDEAVAEQAEDEHEDPALAADRAIHHGFMNQALDMVCSPSLLSPLSSLVSCRLVSCRLV